MVVRRKRGRIVRVAIAGGHGKIALNLTRILSGRGDEVVSLIRKQEQEEDVRLHGAEPILCDLESAGPDELALAIGPVDAVVFAAGAGPGSGPERKETVDHLGAVKLIEAARSNRVPRYVMISATGADPEAQGDDTFAVYLRAKGRADVELTNSGLDYTIVRPTRLTDDPGTGRVQVADKVERSTIPREDVAAVVAECLHGPSAIKMTFELASGDVPISEAISRL